MGREEKTRAILMFEMRLEGASYAQIGEWFGISRQRVEQVLCHREPRRRGRKDLSFIIYPGVRRWMQDERRSVISVHRLISRGESGNAQTTKAKLMGTCKLNINDINAIIRESGKSYEYLFLMSEGEIEEADR